MEEKSQLVTLRTMLPDDESFIFATWLRGLYHGNTTFKEIPVNIFMSEYHKIIEYILKSPNTRILVACLKDDPSVILGYSVMNPYRRALHWVFVKSAWRSIGIARDLIPKDTQAATHITKAGAGMIRKHPTVHFNPFLLN